MKKYHYTYRISNKETGMHYCGTHLKKVLKMVGRICINLKGLKNIDI